VWSVDCGLIDCGVWWGGEKEERKKATWFVKEEREKEDSTYHRMSFSFSIIFLITPFASIFIHSLFSLQWWLHCGYISVHKVVYQRPHTVNPSHRSGKLADSTPPPAK